MRQKPPTMTVIDEDFNASRIISPTIGRDMTIELISYGLKHGPLLRDVDHSYDARHLPNPYKMIALRDLDGRDPRVSHVVFGSTESWDFLGNILDNLMDDDVKAISVYCHGGHHRSVAVVEELAASLRIMKKDVKVTHRDI